MQPEKQPRVSVVIPAFNEQDYIGPCIDSLLDQEIPPLEIIVVDNNSEDDTDSIATSHNLVRVIRERKQGIVYARNTGYNAAKGDIIARCDADSILPPTWTKQIIAALSDPKIAAVTGPCTIYDLPKRLRHLKTGLSASHTLVYFKGSKAMLGHEVLFGSNMALTKQVWEQVKDNVCLDESKMHEDTDLAVHIAEVGGVIKFDPKLQASIAARLRPDTVQAKTSITEVLSYLNRWTNSKLSHGPSKRDKRS